MPMLHLRYDIFGYYMSWSCHYICTYAPSGFFALRAERQDASWRDFKRVCAAAVSARHQLDRTLAHDW